MQKEKKFVCSSYNESLDAYHRAALVLDGHKIIEGRSLVQQVVRDQPPKLLDCIPHLVGTLSRIHTPKMNDDANRCLRCLGHRVEEKPVDVDGVCAHRGM